MKQLNVVPYKTIWPNLFESEAAQIRLALKQNVIAIHHIGSTAVPGLLSKDKIDIIAVVKDQRQTIIPLEAAGYIYKGEWNIPFKYGFVKRGEVDVNLHVYEEGHPEIELNLLFTDYLRKNSAARDEYANLKRHLLKDPDSFERQNGPFSGYTLGKSTFINSILKKIAFNRVRFLRCSHHEEWRVAQLFRQKYFFDEVSILDPYTWTFNHEHFILYQGVEIIGYAHIQRWPQNRAAMRIIVIDEAYRNQGFGSQFLDFCERWLQTQGYKSLHVESNLQALAFYQKNHYIPMPFCDPDDYESDPQDIPLGKIL